MFFHNLNPALFEFGPFEVRYYGLFYALGFIIAYLMLPSLAKIKNIKLSKDDAADFILYLLIGVVLGARLAYIIFYNPLFYLNSPAEIIKLWHGGLSFHGGFLGAIFAAYLFCRKKKIEFYDIADITVVPVALALALGRIGNFINGELYGRITDFSWCIDYSKNQFIQDVPEGCRHPSQIYESLKNFFIFAALWFIKGKKLPKGFMFWSFVAMYGLLRTIAEFFRQPDEQIGFILNYFTMGQLLSFPLFLFGTYMLFRLRRKI
ncbi:prolipoprotein diacylglyceryl transferase [Candidatus Woesearchaeota archaeon]|nr:prolipoprotein diacylglyceryl transferase [Candidatus Woesearchaeota archaeon]